MVSYSPHDLYRGFSSEARQFLDGAYLFRGSGFSEAMALKRDRISIEVFGPSISPETARNGVGRADEAILILARLIGRQIAREQFERKIALDCRPRKKRQTTRNA